MSDTGMKVWRDALKAWNKPLPPSDEAAAAVITAAMAQDKAEHAEAVTNYRAALADCERLRMAAEAELQALKARAADALEPSGDVVERAARAIDPKIWAIDAPTPTRDDTFQFHVRRQKSVELAKAAIAALQAELAAAHQANDTALAMAMQAGADAERGRIVDWLRGQSDKRHDKGYGREAEALSDASDAIEARDWSKP